MSNESSRKKRKVEDNPLDAYLRELARNSKDIQPMAVESPLKDLIGRFVEIALEEEMRESLGHERYERHRAEPEADLEEGAHNSRNGHSRKRLKTSHGTSEIRIPRDRQGEFEPKIVPKYKTISADVEARVIAMYTSGMTTRDIQRHVEELYQIEASEMFVSRLVEKLDPELSAWRNRPLESHYGIVFIDAIHMKVRHAQGVRATAAYQVSGYGESGVLEVLGLYMAPEGESPAESASFWYRTLLEVQQRGVKDILILCADGLTGLREMVAEVYPRTHFSPCVVHLMRRALKPVHDKDRKKVAPKLRAIYQALNYEEAEKALAEVEAAYGKQYPHLVKQWHASLPTLSELFGYSPALRKLVYTTNPIENINRQVRKVTKNRGALPNLDSAIRLLTLVLRDIDARNAARTRPDWTPIARQLHIHFPGRLPEDWGSRYN